MSRREGKMRDGLLDRDWKTDELVYLAKLAEQAERYDEMRQFMKQVAEKKENLNMDERNLMSVAYKNVVGVRRASWRVLQEVKSNNAGPRGNGFDPECLNNYIREVEGELSKICNDILSLLTISLIPNTMDPAEKVFYYKMEGDYYRYMAEYAKGTQKSEEVQAEALRAYKMAMESAKALKHTDSIRLGLVLNYSVFNYEILKDPAEACKLAKHAFDNAVNELEELNEEAYKDATLIMQLLRDNLTLWQTEDEGDMGGADEGDMALEEYA